MFKLKDFRTANNLKQSDLQDILNCKQSFISRVENGREAFPANFIQKLIEVYGKDKVTPFYDEADNEQTSSKQTVPYEFLEALIEERKRHDEMNAELIRQNGKLIQLLEESKKTVAVQKEDNATCADASGSGLGK
jgi:transcriptional regulator with XRE-family HTH domain